MLKVGDVKKTRGNKDIRIIAVDAAIGNGNFDVVGLIDIKGADGGGGKLEFIEWYDSTAVKDGFLHANINREDEHDIAL